VSRWSRREDTRSNDMAHGITFVMFERQTPITRAEIAKQQGGKLHVDGPISLTLALNQWKYGDELIAQLYTKEPFQTYERRSDGYTRVQIFMGPIDLNTAEMLEGVAEEIRKRIGKPRNFIQRSFWEG
jgi:hypothetical protein